MYEGSVRDRKPPFIFLAPKKQKMMTIRKGLQKKLKNCTFFYFLIFSLRNLVTFGNFCTFAADFNTHVYAKNK